MGDSLAGQIAVVTGGNSGVGRSAADLLVRKGVHVTIICRNRERGERALAELREAAKATGAEVELQLADLSRQEDVRGVSDRIAASVERIDILVNNAGIYPMIPALQLSEEVWDRTLDLNLKGLFFASQAAAKAMVDAGHAGSIVNIASVDAIKPIGNLPHYDASKGGVVMLTKSLAKDLGPLGVRVNAIAPGAVQTPGTQVLPEGAIPDELVQMAERLTAAMPLKRQGEPDDIARATVFLSSPAAEYVTGSTLVVDGGMLLI